MSNLVFVTANNLKWLSVMAKNMPEEAEGCYFKLFIEDRIGTQEDDITSIFKNAPGSYEIVHSEDLYKEFSQATGISCDGTLLGIYKMGMNNLPMWHFGKHCTSYDKFLFIDDDIVLREGFIRAFSLTQTSHLKSAFVNASPSSISDCSKNMKRYWDALQEVVQMRFDEVSWVEYKKKYAITGHRVIMRDTTDFKALEAFYSRVYSNEVLYDFCKHYYETGRGKIYAFYLDEITENLFFLSQGQGNNYLKDEKLVHVTYSAPEKTNYAKIVTPIIHVACGQWKHDQYEALAKEGIISLPGGWN